jgi:hypothetical protein
MNPARIHLLANHAPLFCALFACLLLAYALARRHAAYERLAYVLLIAAALAAPVVFFSGHGAEDRVEGLLGVSESRIHAHEEAGEAAAVGLVLLGILAGSQFLLGWFPERGRWRARGAVATLIGAALLSGWLAWTSHLGGLIRHGAELDKPAPWSDPASGMEDGG